MLPHFHPTKRSAIILSLIAGLTILLFAVLKKSPLERSVIREISPPSQNITPNPTPPSSVVGLLPPANISYTGQPFTPPESLPIYSTSPLDLHAITAAIAAHLNLTPHPRSNLLWQDPTQSISLSYQPVTGTVEYSLSVNDSLPLGLDPNQASAIAERFLNELNQPHLSINYAQTQFLPAGMEFDLNSRFATHPSSATYAFFPLHFLLDSLPVFIDSHDQYTQRIVVNSRLDVISAKFNPLPNLTPGGSTRTISLDQAVLNMNSQPTPLVNLHSGQLITENQIATITNINFKKASLSYRLNRDAQQILPFYNFTGTATIGIETIEIEATTPAYQI